MIEFRSVTKRLPDGTVAVDDFSLVIPSRKITVLVGSSGSGKTTILRMVNRMVDPTSGTVSIDGEDVQSLKPVHLRRRIGYVMQNSGLLPHRKVVDNIATVPLLTGARKKDAYGHALELMDTVGLERSLADKYPSQLSGGQQQRVGVARGLAVDPNILLMDEPFGAVDPIVRDDLQNELLRLQRELGKGGIVAQKGTPAEILASPADDFVASFVGADRGKRALHIEQTPSGSVLVDSEGRTAGVLSSEPSPDVDSKAATVSVAGGADAVTQGGAPPRLPQ